MSPTIRPARSHVEPQNIPPELQAVDRWVTWRWALSRTGSWTKIPHIPGTGRKASSTDATTWRSFGAALTEYVAGTVDGIGFMFGDGWAGIDLDKMRDCTTGALTAFAQETVEIGTYTEITPRAEGLHLIMRGTLPAGGRKRGGIEAYDTARFFTMTGNHLTGTPTTVNERTDALAAWHAKAFGESTNGNGATRPASSRPASTDEDLDDAEVLALANSARNGGKFRPLWAGDTSGYPSASEADLALCSMLGFYAEAAQIDRLFHQSALYREKWATKRGASTYGAQTVAKAIAGRTERYTRPKSRTRSGRNDLQLMGPVPDFELKPDPKPVDVAVVDATQEVLGDVPPDATTVTVGAPPTEHRLTEAGAAERFAAQHADRLRYDHRRSRWLLWDGHRWQPDEDGEIVRIAIKTGLRWQHQALDIHDPKLKTAVLAWATSFDRRQKIEALLALAKCMAPLADDGARWDAHPWLWGCPNGVVDLKTGTLRPGRPTDNITKQGTVPFDPDATCPRFDQFVREIFPDPKAATYTWRALGYSLTGDMREQAFFLLHGRGRNGKSTLMDTVVNLMGDYARPTPFDAFEVQQGQSIPVDVAALDGLRLTTSTETNGRWLHAPRLKDLTGGERMTVRHLYGNPFAFRPTVKVWLSVNERPRIADDSEGLWRRLKEVPFTQRFEGAADDKGLKDKLAAEAPGILAWMVRGCLSWQADGLDAPPAVTDAVDEYRRDSDVLAGFLEEACDLGDDFETPASAFYATYKAWAERAGMTEREMLKATGFGRKVSERFRRVRTRGGAVYLGVRGSRHD